MGAIWQHANKIIINAGGDSKMSVTVLLLNRIEVKLK